MSCRQTGFFAPAAGCAAVLLTFLFVNDAAGAEPAPDATAPPVIYRTEADIEQGKRNVKSVLEELSMLWEREKNRPTVPGNLRAAPPYSKVISSSNDRATLVFRPRFTTVKEVFRTLDGVVGGSVYLESMPEQNLLVLSAPKNEIENYRELLIAMDPPTPQILVEAKVVEMLFSDGSQRNIAFSYTDGNSKAGFSAAVPGAPAPDNGAGTNWSFGGNDAFNIAFQWLLTAQDARVLSSPNILITRNEISQIVSASDIPIQEANTTTSNTSITTKFKRVGVTLEVEPCIINDNNVTLRVYPTVSNVSGYQAITSSGQDYSVPVIAVRSTETYLRMIDQQVVMMGGLYNRVDVIQQQRVPILSDIPGLGEIFTGKNKSKEVTQLIFFLKIHIIPAEESTGSIVFDPDRNAELSENLGELLRSGDNYPVRERSYESFMDEVDEMMPGRERERRLNYRRSIDSGNPRRSERFETVPEAVGSPEGNDEKAP